MLWLILLLIGNLAAFAGGERQLPFTYSISVENDTYAIGEPIAVSFKLTNTSSSLQKIQKWRGPLAGVSRGRDDFDFAVYRLTDDARQRVDYKGMFACGSPSYMLLKPNESWHKTYVIGKLDFPAYSLRETGRYQLCSTYFSSPNEKNPDAFKGKLSAKPVNIKVVRLNKSRLSKIRKKIRKGDHVAISIVAMHYDVKSIPVLAKLCSSDDLETRKLTYIGLGIIGTDDALHALGKAVLNEPDCHRRIQIIDIFQRAKDPVAIPYLKRLLKDPYSSVVGMNGRKYRQYIVRRDASYVLNKLGVEDNTPYLEEFKEKIATLPDDRRNKLFNDALSKNHKAQFEAVRELAISGYSPSSADILAKIAYDCNTPETTRDYAAMGLGNFTNSIPNEDKTSIREKLKRVVKEEKIDTPDGIIRLLGRWGAACFVYEALGEQLKGHTLEIDVLEHIEDDYATKRLWQIYQDCPKGRKAKYYKIRTRVGKVLVGKGDIRGIDILMTLLPKDKAPGPEYRNSVYILLAITIGNNFGYEDGNYRPELEQVVAKMMSWWEENRLTFEFHSNYKQ